MQIYANFKVLYANFFWVWYVNPPPPTFRPERTYGSYRLVNIEFIYKGTISGT